MSIPKYDELMNPTITALHSLGGSASVSEIEEAVAEQLGLSARDLGEIHRGNRTKFSYRLAWTRNYLKRFNVLENSSRGVWALTPKGLKTEKIDRAEVKRFVKTLDGKLTKTSKAGSKDIRNGEDLGVEEAWKNRLLSVLKKMAPDSFERLCQRLLRESGFMQVVVTGRSGDGGIDGKGVVKVGGLLSFHVVFQCKRYGRSVSTSVVRDFRGAMVGRADKGLLVTTGTFTRDAKIEATRDGAPPIDLIDGEMLADKLKELNLGVDVKAVTTEVITINEDWFASM